MTGTKTMSKSEDLENRYQAAREQLQQAEQAFRSHEEKSLANRQALKRETDIQKIVALQNETTALEMLTMRLRDDVARKSQDVQAVVTERENLSHYVQTLKDKLANAWREKQYLEMKRGQAEDDIQQAQIALRQAEAVIAEHDGKVKVMATELATLA